MTWRGSSGERKAQERFGTAERAAVFYDTQMLHHLNPPMQEFIARMEMVFIATADARGDCDSSFRAGPAGFVRVLDEKTLVYPEYRGNGVLASVGNMMENPRIGLCFIDYFLTTVGLHVNGTAKVLDPSEFGAFGGFAALGVTGAPSDSQLPSVAGTRRPDAWVVVGVEEAYIHCSKHVPLLARVDKQAAWATDADVRRGGNVFKVKP